MVGATSFLVKLFADNTPRALPLCPWCSEEVEPCEQGPARQAVRLRADGGVQMLTVYYHRPCEVRSVVGSIEHQRAVERGEYDCRAHRHGEEPEFGTAREHARFAAAYFYKRVGVSNPEQEGPGR